MTLGYSYIFFRIQNYRPRFSPCPWVPFYTFPRFAVAGDYDHSQKEHFEEAFTDVDADGNKLKLRRNTIETWMNLLRLSPQEIEFFKSKLSVKNQEKGVQISAHMNVDVLDGLRKNNTSNFKQTDASDGSPEHGRYKICYKKYWFPPIYIYIYNLY